MFYSRIKRISAIILAVVMILSISACQKTEDASTGRVPAVLTFRDPDGTIIADNSDIEKASVEKNGSEYYISIKFNEEGTEKFAEATMQLAENQEILYVYLDDEILMSPTVTVPITNGEALITGNYTKEEAEELADTINYGRRVFETVTQSKAEKTTDNDNENQNLPFMTTKYTLTELVPTKYDEIQDFSEGLAAVRIDGKWGFIDENANECIFPIYEYVSSFNEGLAAVCINQKWGFINEKGKEVIPVQYEYVSTYSDGLCYVKSDNNEFFIDSTGTEVFRLSEYSIYYSFSEGYATIYKISDDGVTFKFGIIDKNGKIVVPCIYDYASVFSEDYFLIGFNSIEEVFGSRVTYTNSGLIDINGNFFVQPEYHSIDKYVNGMAKVTKGISKYGFIDINGKEIIPTRYDSARDFNSDGYAIVSINNQYGVIDKTGQEVIPLIYDSMGVFNSDGYAIVSINNQYGVIDKNGQEVIPLIYNEIYNLVDGVATVELNGKVGFLDTNGDEAIPLIYDEMGIAASQDCYFSEGLAPVQLNGKIGFINKSGKEVISFKYDEVIDGFSSSTGLAHVRIGDKYGYIDKTGKEIVSIKYGHSSYSFSTTNGFRDGLAGVAIESRFGFVDTNGNEVTDFKWAAYDQYTDADGIIFVANNRGGTQKWGLLKYTKEMVPINIFDIPEPAETTVSAVGGEDFGYWTSFVEFYDKVYESDSSFYLVGPRGEGDRTDAERIKFDSEGNDYFIWSNGTISVRLCIRNLATENGDYKKAIVIESWSFNEYDRGEIICWSTEDLSNIDTANGMSDTVSSKLWEFLVLADKATTITEIEAIRDKLSPQLSETTVSEEQPASFEIDPLYVNRLNSTFGGLTHDLDSYEFAASHNNYYGIWESGTQVVYVFDSVDGNLSDDDKIAYIQAPLGVLAPNMPESTSVYKFANSLENPFGSENQASIEGSYGAGYYISDLYAKVNFSFRDDSGTGYGAMLEISAGDDAAAGISGATITKNSLTWLKFVGG